MDYRRFTLGSSWEAWPAPQSVLLCLCHQHGPSGSVRVLHVSPLLRCLHPTVRLCSWGRPPAATAKGDRLLPAACEDFATGTHGTAQPSSWSRVPAKVGDREGKRAGRPPALQSLSQEPCHPALLRLCPPRADFLLGGAWQVGARFRQATARRLPPTSPEAKAAAPPHKGRTAWGAHSPHRARTAWGPFPSLAQNPSLPQPASLAPPLSGAASAFSPPADSGGRPLASPLWVPAFLCVFH